ncbi:MAG: hypothetical protein KBB00_03170 [Methanospirillum sp.]|nr:hypothetical protein [Methanospirillum sp.]
MAFDRRSEILRTLHLISSPGRVVEVRIITNDGIGSGYFDDFEKLADQVCILDDNPQIRGIYITLNEVNPALLARRANRIIIRLSKKDATTADKDIIRRHWFPIDIDPVRPSGVSSSDEEHRYALAKAKEISAYLHSVGWPEPIIADSGNGAHLLYRIDLPNDDAATDIIKKSLNALSARFSDDICTIDTANYNAARIWKLYGTMTRKGDNTPPRSHRVASLTEEPVSLSLTGCDHLATLASLYPSESGHQPSEKCLSKCQNDTPVNLATWLSRHDIGYMQKPYGNGTLFILDQCPFSDAHQDGAYAIQFESGAIFAGCHHNSCGGGMQRWKDLKQKYEGKPDSEDRLSRMHKDNARRRYHAEQNGLTMQRSERPDGADPADPGLSGISDLSMPRHRKKPKKSGIQQETPTGSDNEENPEITRKAEEILRKGNPVRYMRDTFALDHVGDQVVAECLILSLASRIVINSKGLHVSITGDSGKGKSHAIDTMLAQVPEEFRLSGRISDKALFYSQDLKPGTVIALDDVSLSEQMQEILKGVITSFLKPFRYRTVTKDRNGITCTIPERCVWWVAKVEGVGDDQIFNRMLTVWIDDSEEQDKKVLERTLREAAQIPTAVSSVREEILVIRQMWRMVEETFVIIPYAEQIEFQSAANRRNPDMLLDLIKTNAALMQFQRERRTIEGTEYIIATLDDFNQAVRLYNALNGDTGGQITKLTRNEASLIDAIRTLNQEELTVLDIQRVTGWTNSAISKLLNGYASRGHLYSGLLQKCPALSFYDRSVTVGDVGKTTHRRSKVYVWDNSLYLAWVKGGAVSLRQQDEDHHDTTTPPDDPEDDFRNFSAESNRFSASAENERTSDLSQNSTCTHILRDRESFSETGTFTEEAADVRISTGNHECESLCPDRAAENESLLSSNQPSLSNQGNQNGRITAENSRKHAEKIAATIKPDDYLRIEGWPEKRPCHLCGRSYVQYRKRSLKENEEPAFLCADCYNKAVSRYVASIIPLPGLISTDQMVRLNAGAGKCHVCNTNPLVWYDHASHLGLCDACYLREQSKKSEGGSSCTP